MKRILLFLSLCASAFGQAALDVSIQQVNAGGTAFNEVLVPFQSAVTTLASYRSAIGLGTEDAVTFSAISGTTGTFTGNGSFGANALGGVQIDINAAAGNPRDIRTYSGGVLRWIYSTAGVTESGSNAGSPFRILARDDSGNAIDTPFEIVRAAGGVVAIVRPLTVSSTTASTSTSTGAVVIGNGTSGGLGVGGQVVSDGFTFGAAPNSNYRFYGASATAGIPVTLRLSHTEATNAASSAKVLLDTAAGGGDAFVNFVAGATEYALGVDNSADTFVLSSSGTLGTTNIFSVSGGAVAFSGNVTTIGSISTGVGGSTAGVLELGQGTAPSDGTTSVKIYASTGVTSYKRLLPAAVGSSGYTYQTVSGTTQTESQVSDATLATAVRATIIEKIAVFSVDGGGSAIATGTVAGTSRIPFACTLTGYSITATAATGTNTIKIWLKATATSIPTISDVINTSGVSLTTGTAVASATLSDFTDTVYAAGDMARCAITAVDGAATDLTVTLYGTRL